MTASQTAVRAPARPAQGTERWRRAGPLRWSGAALLLGGLGYGVVVALLTSEPVHTQQPPATLAGLLLGSSVLLIVGLPGLYAAQAVTGGAGALVGHVLLSVGLFLGVLYAAPPVLYPSLEAGPAENVALFALGFMQTAGLLVTGFVTLRSRVFPRPAALMILVAAVGFFFDFFVAETLPDLPRPVSAVVLPVPLIIGFGWIGVALLTGRQSRAGADTAPDAHDPG